MMVHAGHASTLAEAARLLERETLVNPARQDRVADRQRVGREQASEARRRRRAASLWASAGPLQGSLAETYLRQGRAISAPLESADLRFLANAPVWPLSADCRERAPALIAKVTNAEGRGIGAHLTYLSADGLAKADLSPPRKAVGPIAGGFIRLAPGVGLIVAEGIETTLSAWQARPEEVARYGAVAAISAGGMAALVWPVETDALLIAPDNDAAGAEAAGALARRAWIAGHAVNLMRPPDSFGDWNAWAQGQRGRS
jgi:hypothetical protein